MNKEKEKKNMGIGAIDEINAKKKKKLSMGIGVIGQPGTIFPRQFRWTVASKNCDLAKEYSIKFKSNYVKKTIRFKLMELIAPDGKDCPVDEWIRETILNKNKDDLTLTTYDGIGEKLYSLIFSGIEIIDHKSPYDYKSSDIVCHDLKIRYSKVERIYHLKEKNGDSKD